jgi:RNA polymerase sigma-70 factor (ECF subfamily)
MVSAPTRPPARAQAISTLRSASVRNALKNTEAAVRKSFWRRLFCGARKKIPAAQLFIFQDRHNYESIRETALNTKDRAGLSVFQQLGFHSRRTRDADDGLVAAARRGDRAAFDALVRRHQPLLRGFLRRQVDPNAAEDVLQETWVAAWAGLPEFAGRARFKAWLFGIARHKAMDQQRANKRFPTETLTEETSTEYCPARNPFSDVDRNDAVQYALSELPETQREVLELYYFAELTLPEIAQTLGRSQNTVKYQFYRAHALAADRLERE